MPDEISQGVIPALHSIKNVARNEMESGFKKGMSKFKPTLFNRKEN